MEEEGVVVEPGNQRTEVYTVRTINKVRTVNAVRTINSVRTMLFTNLNFYDESFFQL